MSILSSAMACMTSCAGVGPRSIPFMFWKPNRIQCGGMVCLMSSPKASYRESDSNVGCLDPCGICGRIVLFVESVDFCFFGWLVMYMYGDDLDWINWVNWGVAII